jgi:hypothetical protein
VVGALGTLYLIQGGEREESQGGGDRPSAGRRSRTDGTRLHTHLASWEQPRHPQAAGQTYASKRARRGEVVRSARESPGEVGCQLSAVGSVKARLRTSPPRCLETGLSAARRPALRSSWSCRSFRRRSLPFLFAFLVLFFDVSFHIAEGRHTARRAAGNNREKAGAQGRAAAESHRL